MNTVEYLGRCACNKHCRAGKFAINGEAVHYAHIGRVDGYLYTCSMAELCKEDLDIRFAIISYLEEQGKEQEREA